MKKLLPLGLVTAAALLFAVPVAASEVRSTQRDVEELQGMIQRSQERQGIIPAPVEPAPAPAPEPAPASVTPEPIPAPVEPAPAPAPEPAPARVAPEPVQPPAPTPVETASAPRNEPAPVLASVPAQYSSAKDTASTITPPACLGREWPTNRNSLDYQFRQEHMVCLLVTDEAWKQADLKNYGLGADLEKGMPTLAAMRKHAPHILPRALAILRGEEVYT